MSVPALHAIARAFEPWRNAMVKLMYELYLDILDRPQIDAMADDGCPNGYDLTGDTSGK